MFRGGFGGGWESRFGDGGTVGGGDGGGVQRSGVDGLGSCALEPVERSIPFAGRMEGSLEPLQGRRMGASEPVEGSIPFAGWLEGRADPGGSGGERPGLKSLGASLNLMVMPLVAKSSYL